MQALTNSTTEYESLESEVSALHDDLWEQLNLDIQVTRALGRGGGSGPHVLYVSPCPCGQKRPEWLPLLL